jgi:hypothetical protein
MLVKEESVNLALKAYDNPFTKTYAQFVEDYSRLKYIRRCLTRFKKSNKINERLLLNHLVLWFNSFRTDFSLPILMKEFNSEEDLSILIPCIEKINYLPEGNQFQKIKRNEEIVNKLNNL